MTSIQKWVGRSLPSWMGRVAGIALIAAGLVWPAITMPSAVTPVAATTNVLPIVPENLPPPQPLALTPPMGWNGFNRFYHDVTEERVEAQARALVDSGMKAAGYEYVNLDGGWDLATRNSADQLQPNPARFPNGIKPVADYVHSLGLKFGIYASAGLMNCAHTSAGSFGHFLQDAEMFAAWGVDYVKLDWCFIPFGDYPKMSHPQVSELLAGEMATAIEVTGRPMLLDVNDWYDHSPGTWARGVARVWRTTHDSRDAWWSVLLNFRNNVSFYKLAGPGGWNDPDMLEIGNGGMTTTEYQTQFSLWSEMAAPLIAGNDLTRMSPVTRRILTNRAVIAVDQDSLGRQGYPVSSSRMTWVLAKPLADGHVAVVLFNANPWAETVSTTISQLGLPRGSVYKLVDLWSGAEHTTAGPISALLAPHAVAMYLVVPPG